MIKQIKSLFINEYNILILIIINAITIIIQGFTNIPSQFLHWAFLIDNIISLLFIIEMTIKLNHFGRRAYFSSGWNRLDFILVLISTPSLILLFYHSSTLDIGFLYTLRLLRTFKFFRFLKFVPNIEHLILGIKRAMKASLLIFFAFFIFNLIVALFSNYMFREIAPEFFGNPLTSFYSIFKIFTVEGWYEIPDAIAENTSETTAFMVKLFFVGILIAGGVIGLSLVNSIFVDAMVSDNTNNLEVKVAQLESKIDELNETMKKVLLKDDNLGS